MEGIVFSLQGFKETNQKLESFIEILSPGQKTLSVTPAHMATLLAEVVQAGEWLRAGSGNDAREGIADELEGYRQRLQKLLYLLPSFHAQLLTERCRLQAEKDHLEATAAWARSVRV